MRVAIVHYWLVNMGGGEKVLESLCRLYPQAHIYTHVLDPHKLSPVIAGHPIHTTFINKLPFSKKRYQGYLPLMPLALEQLDLTDYDLVISSESGPAKGVITRADTPHICYCHTPMRYLWDNWAEYLSSAGFLTRCGMRLFLPSLRRWDLASSFRVDHFVANSHNVARRIRKHWRRDAAVVPPPVNTSSFTAKSNPGGEHYLCFGRLTAYKRVDLAVRACTMLEKPLVVMGDGEEMDKLKTLAGPTVRFLGRVDDSQIATVLATSKALLFPGEEDFGIVPLEAAASGVPVLAYGRGGALETVRNHETGLFFEQQTPEALAAAINEFEQCEMGFDPALIRRHAENFSEHHFQARFAREVDTACRAVGQGQDKSWCL